MHHPHNCWKITQKCLIWQFCIFGSFGQKFKWDICWWFSNTLRIFNIFLSVRNVVWISCFFWVWGTFMQLSLQWVLSKRKQCRCSCVIWNGFIQQMATGDLLNVILIFKLLLLFLEGKKYTRELKGKKLICPWDIAFFVCIVFCSLAFREPRWDLEGVFFVQA